VALEAILSAATCGDFRMSVQAFVFRCGVFVPRRAQLSLWPRRDEGHKASQREFLYRFSQRWRGPPRVCRSVRLQADPWSPAL